MLSYLLIFLNHHALFFIKLYDEYFFGKGQHINCTKFELCVQFTLLISVKIVFPFIYDYHFCKILKHFNKKGYQFTKNW